MYRYLPPGHADSPEFDVQGPPLPSYPPPIPLPEYVDGLEVSVLGPPLFPHRHADSLEFGLQGPPTSQGPADVPYSGGTLR